MQCYTFLYTRTAHSAAGHQSRFLDAQEEQCRAYAARHALPVSEVIREVQGAYGSPRPLYEAMLQKAEALRKKGMRVWILCASPDRLTRDLSDWSRLNGIIQAGVELIFVTRTAAATNPVFCSVVSDITARKKEAPGQL